MLIRGDFTLLWRKLFQSINGPDLEAWESHDEDAAYNAWMRGHALTDADRTRLRREAGALADPPVFSILLHAAGCEGDLRRSIESVLRQTYPAWQLCIAGAEPPDIARSDDRIRIVRGGGAGAAAVQAVLEAASGHYITLLDAGDELAEHALSRLARAATEDRGLAMLYADEDRLNAEGRRVEPFFKPDWSPELFLSWMYTGRPGVYRTALVRQMGGFRPEFSPAHEYDLALRLTTGSAARGPCPRRPLPSRDAARSGGERGSAAAPPQSSGPDRLGSSRRARPCPRAAPAPFRCPRRSYRQHHHCERLPAGARPR